MKNLGPDTRMAVWMGLLALLVSAVIVLGGNAYHRSYWTHEILVENVYMLTEDTGDGQSYAARFVMLKGGPLRAVRNLDEAHDPYLIAAAHVGEVICVTTGGFTIPAFRIYPAIYSAYAGVCKK